MKIFSFKTKTLQDLFNFFFYVSCSNNIQTMIDLGEFFDQLHVTITLVIGARFELVIDIIQTFLHLLNLSVSSFRLRENSTSMLVSHILRQITDLAFAWNRDFSFTWILQTGK